MTDWLDQLRFMGMKPMSTPEMAQGEDAALYDYLNQRLQQPKAATAMVSGPAPMPFKPNAELSKVAVANLMSPEDRATQNKLRMKYDQLLNQSESGIEELKRQARQWSGQPQEVDWTPAAATLDSLFGSKLSPAAQAIAPMKPEEKMKILAGINQQIQGDRQKLLDTVGKEIDSSNNMKMLDLLSKNSRQETNLMVQGENNIRNQLQKEVVGPAADEQRNFETMDAALSTGDSQKVMNVLSNYARSVSGEKGVLTDHDITRVMPRNYQGTVASFLSYLSNTPSASLPPEYTKSMREMISLAKQKVADKYKKQLEYKKTSFSSGYYSPLMSPGKVGDVTFKQAEDVIKGFGSQPSSAINVDQDAIAAEMKRRGL